MKTKIRIAIKFTAFVLLAVMCVSMINEWLMPKYYFTETWSTTNTYKDFYRLKRDTVDVLLFGSSHAVSTLNPQVIYDNYGITSYNLGCEQQSLVVTYYWLREALKYQSPKVVVLDTHMLHKYTDAYVYNDMNCSEGSVRKAMDSMRISPLKWEAGRAIAEIDPTQSALSFSLLNIRYHTRWISLGESDYTEAEMMDHGGIKGFSVCGGREPGSVYTPFAASDARTVKPEKMVETAKEYLDKIVQLCSAENIQLILINIPCEEAIGKYKATSEYAESVGLPYYDFNEETLYNEIGYDAAEDLLGHPNYLGAEKVSDYLGRLLLQEYGVAPREDASYDSSRELYEHKIQNIELRETTDICQYLEKLDDERYSIFLFGPTSYSAEIDDTIMSSLSALGFTTDLRAIEEGTHYCAVRDAGKITERLTEDDFSFSGSIRGGLTTYRFAVDTTNMLPSCHQYSMVISGTECGNMNAGINIVVYDNEMKKIVDKVNFDTTAEGIPAARY